MTRRGRPRKGDRRIDAAIDHFAAMGYAARDVRAIVDRLLTLYGGVDAWPLLEEGSYQIVQDLLFEKQEEEKEQLRLQHHPQEEEQQVEVAQEPSQHQELAEDEALPENNMAVLEHNDVSAVPDSQDVGVKGPVCSELPTLQVAMPHRIRIGGVVRPCFGWISESDDEEEITNQQPEKHNLSLEGSLYKRKRSD